MSTPVSPSNKNWKYQKYAGLYYKLTNRNNPKENKLLKCKKISEESPEETPSLFSNFGYFKAETSI